MTASNESAPSALAHGDESCEGGGGLPPTSARLARAAALDAASVGLIQRLLKIAVGRLSLMYVDGEFVSRVDGKPLNEGWELVARGTSTRYGAIVALGLLRLPVDTQRAVLGGATCQDLIGRLIDRAAKTHSLGDVALICWAAAEGRHAAFPNALSHLAEIVRQTPAPLVVDLAWTVSALVAARALTDVEAQLSRARNELLSTRGVVGYPHVAGAAGPWYRRHVGSFADQIYPVQALARLHASAADSAALTVAESVARAICAAQGRDGQWWWHYDSRTGGVVEGYPVYSVHQHAMAPMALMDLAEAGGKDYLTEICRGVRWLANPPEAVEPLVLSDPPVTWRKVARNDFRKAIRGARAASTKIHADWHLGWLDPIFQPGVVDHECRPYELGWLLMSWL